MRQREVLGLQWDDIDFDTGSLKVNRTLSRQSRNEFLTLPPKTKSSKRTIPVPAIALAGLTEQKRYADEHHPERTSSGKCPNQK
jgi:integrase